MLPMQPGDVPATYADIEDLARDIGYDFGRLAAVGSGLRKFHEGLGAWRWPR
jgi:UDP-glucuronate 4-epimerase